MALRIPSIVAMLGAVYFLYRAARELFGREFAFIVCIVFCSNPIIIFAAVDVRAYAFATLAMSACIFLLVRLRNNDSNWLPALLGLMAAAVLWFHFLFAVFLPALLAGFIILKASDRKTLWRQLGISLLAFGLAFWPLVPGYLAMFHTRGTHVFEETPCIHRSGQNRCSGMAKMVICPRSGSCCAPSRPFGRKQEAIRVGSLLRSSGGDSTWDSVRSECCHSDSHLCCSISDCNNCRHRAGVGIDHQSYRFAPAASGALSRARSHGGWP